MSGGLRRSALGTWGATTLVVALSALVLIAAPAASAATYAVTVTPGTVLNTGTANAAKLGINLDYWWDNDANRLSGAPPLSTALAGMKLKNWRYPGGEKADGYLWSTPPFTSSNPRLARVSSNDWPANDPAYWTPAGDPSGTWAHPVMSFDQFMTACNAAGCVPNLVVAYDGAYKAAYSGGTSLTFQQALDTAKGWVSYAKSNGFAVGYWDIGNETWNSGYMGEDPGRTQQANDFVTFANALHAIDPTAKLCTNANKQSDFNTLLTIAHAQIDCLVAHSYPAWPFRSYSSYLSNSALIPEEVDMAYNALQACTACTAADKSRIKVIENEYGGFTFGIRGSWTQNDLGHALMTAEMTARLGQDSRVAASAFWTTRWINNTSDTPVDEYDALNAHNGLFAQGKALNLIATNTLATMVSASPQTGKLQAFASYDPGTKKLNVFLINKDTVASTANVSLSGYTGTATSGAVTALTGTASTDLFPTVSSQGNVSISGNAFTINLSPVSVTLISIGGGAADVTPPVAPTGLTASAVSASQINLDWADNTEPDLASYSVYRSTTSGFTPSTSNRIASGLTTSAYSSTGLTASTTYYYKVTALDTSGNESAASAQASATTQAGDATPPAAPVGLAAAAVSSSQINLSWTANSEPDLASYKVYRSTTSGFTPGAGNLIASGVTTSSYQSTGLAGSTTYYYKVSAVDTSSNESAASAQAAATTQAGGGTCGGSTNLALNKPATATATQGGYPPSNAVDGDSGTRWWSLKSSLLTADWLQVDLGAATPICKATVIQGDRYATSYDIQVSDDGSSWTTVASKTGSVGGTESFTFSTSGRYVRFYSTAWLLSTDHVKLYELAVY